MRVLIAYNLAGSDNLADDDTRIQAEYLAALLEQRGQEAILLPLPANATLAHCRDTVAGIARTGDLVWNLVESLMGSARQACMTPSVFQGAGLACTGSGTMALLRSTNKLLAKRILLDNGLPTPPLLDLRGLLHSAPLAEDNWIVKSVWEHASLGLTAESVLHAPDLEQAVEALAGRKQLHGGEWFAEAYIEGRELNVSLLADDTAPGNVPEVLPPAEILFQDWDGERPMIVDHGAKWDENDPVYVRTPRSYDFADTDRELLRRVAALARSCWRVFDLQGYARVDFRVDIQGTPWIIDVNANPCLAPDAGFMAAVHAAGIPSHQALTRIQSASGIR